MPREIEDAGNNKQLGNMWLQEIEIFLSRGLAVLLLIKLCECAGVNIESILIVDRIGNYCVNKNSCIRVMNSSKNMSFSN